MDFPSTPSAGILDSIRGFADTLLATVHDRLELISVELQEEKHRLIQTFIWICAAIFTGMMAITFASITLVYLLWESARLAALGGLTLLYTAALVTIIVSFKRYVARQPKPFAASLSEIKVDRVCIRPEN